MVSSDNPSYFVDRLQKYIRDLVKHIIAKWHGKVEQDYINNPFTAEEQTHVEEKYRRRYAEGYYLHHAYGTTLIAAAITKEYWFGIHIDDGRFTVLYRNGEFDQPVPWDERYFLNITTSICDDDAFEGARIHYAPALSAAEKLPAGVFLCSDGVDDNYPVEGNEEYLYKLYRTITLAFVDDGFDSTCGQLRDLANKFATEGKGDDTSIARIIDMEAIKALEPLLREQIFADARKEDAERAAKVEAERLAAERARVDRAKREADKTEADHVSAVEPPEEKLTNAKAGCKAILKNTNDSFVLEDDVSELIII
jgi:hypothetical protein